jgi:hypothetical protein
MLDDDELPGLVDPAAGPDERIPDLRTLPRELWMDALRPLARIDRERATGRLTDFDAWMAAKAVTGMLELEGPPPITEVPTPRLPAPPSADGAHRQRQVNIRLSAEAYRRLTRLAGILEMRPAVLAKLMVVRGVDAALREREA